jgi:hypothetical protein
LTRIVQRRSVSPSSATPHTDVGYACAHACVQEVPAAAAGAHGVLFTADDLGVLRFWELPGAGGGGGRCRAMLRGPRNMMAARLSRGAVFAVTAAGAAVRVDLEGRTGMELPRCALSSLPALAPPTMSCCRACPLQRVYILNTIDRAGERRAWHPCNEMKSECPKTLRPKIEPEWRAAERRHPTGRGRKGSPTLQTLQDPILLLPWVCSQGGGFPALPQRQHTHTERE